MSIWRVDMSDLVSNTFCIQMISEWSGFIKSREMDQIKDLELVGILRAKWEEAAENLLQQIFDKIDEISEIRMDHWL